jgi:hypothetical protein
MSLLLLPNLEKSGVQSIKRREVVSNTTIRSIASMRRWSCKRFGVKDSRRGRGKRREGEM